MDVIAQCFAALWRATDGNNWFCHDKKLLHEGDHIVEVGGYVGDYVESLSHFKKNLRFTVYEPLPRYANALRARFDNKNEVTIIQAALSDKNGIMRYNDEGIGSNANLTGQIVVRTLDVSKELENGCDFLSMNCEGGEYTILPRLIDSGVIKKINVLQIDFHPSRKDWKKQREELRHQLSQTHTLYKIFPYIKEQWVLK